MNGRFARGNDESAREARVAAISRGIGTTVAALALGGALVAGCANVIGLDSYKVGAEGNAGTGGSSGASGGNTEGGSTVIAGSSSIGGGATGGGEQRAAEQRAAEQRAAEQRAAVGGATGRRRSNGRWPAERLERRTRRAAAERAAAAR